jgi:3-deoxy-manno-octulosonate cytidylyltransferase (CMP-KDO synthetase)
MKIVGIIPARFGSSRFPGKPLAMIHGKSMIQRVIEQSLQAQALSAVIVATDDQRIFNHVSDLGHQVVMTSTDHPSGTDRCLEALTKSGIKADAVINIQGDEPFVHPSQIDSLATLISQENVEIATLVKRIHDAESLFNGNKVKVVFNKESGRALYFSRQAIPALRGVAADQWLFHHHFYKHLGLYAYKANVLEAIAHLKPSPLELAESLEQLRWLENGYSIFVAETDHETPAVDTPEDLKNILKGSL